MSPYLSEYDSISDITICTAATAVDLESGETIILEFGQSQWFGERMKYSLINPNHLLGFASAMILRINTARWVWKSQRHNITTSEYASREDGDDFVKDDVAVPTGHEDDGDYFGPSGVPDIDDIIDNENERTQSDLYDKNIGAEIVLPNSAGQILMARVKKKVMSNDKNGSDY